MPMIPVTIPFLPPKHEYDKYLEKVWDKRWLTNMGPLATELEEVLKSHLSLDHLLYVSNGTIALQIAIKALKLKGEIITTPFSYVATTSSIVWEGCEPVFVDIDKNSLNIDPNKIERAISDRTSAILATHVYGNPCDVLAIEKIAKKHNLKVIYDAAHAFGVKINGDSIFLHGDISTCSLHATKIYHTIEGGLVVSKEEGLIKKMSYARNFGHDGPEKFFDVGINGKNSEFHAAMGLVNLKHTSSITNKRKQISERYDENLKGFKAIKPVWHNKSKTNYSYYPLIFESEEFLLKCIKVLNANEIYGRRYFYPSLAQCLPYIKSVSLKYTDDISKRVYCLPLYYTLTLAEVDTICNLLLKVNNS